MRLLWHYQKEDIRIHEHGNDELIGNYHLPMRAIVQIVISRNYHIGLVRIVDITKTEWYSFLKRAKGNE
jgi:hypothetical protein